MKLSKRHKDIIEVVKRNEPITSEGIANELSLGKSTLRNDLTVLSMLEILDAKPNVGYYFNYNFSHNTNKGETKSKVVKDVMGVAITAKSTEQYDDVLTKLFIYDVGTIFVVDDNNILQGVVSRKDMLKLSKNNDSGKIPIALAMTRTPNVIYVEEETLVIDALRKIIAHEIDCLPVVKNDMKVVGKISKTTLIKLLLEILEG